MSISWQFPLLISRPSCSILYKCSLVRFCSSPEPGTNYSMLSAWLYLLIGTVWGYEIVSRTQKNWYFLQLPTTYNLAERPHKFVRAPTSNLRAHSRPEKFMLITLPTFKLARWWILNKCLAQNCCRRIWNPSQGVCQRSFSRLGYRLKSDIIFSLPDTFISWQVGAF